MITHELGGARHDQGGDEQAGEHIGLHEPGRGDDDRRDDHSERPEGIVENFEGRGAQIEVGTATGGENGDGR